MNMIELGLILLVILGCAHWIFMQSVTNGIPFMADLAERLRARRTLSMAR